MSAVLSSRHCDRFGVKITVLLSAFSIFVQTNATTDVTGLREDVDSSLKQRGEDHPPGQGTAVHLRGSQSMAT